MYNSAFYKLGARDRLRGCYAVAAICAIIFMLPQYLMSRIVTMIDITYPGIMLVGDIAAVLVEIFVINIFEIGFIRFLMRMKPAGGNSERSYDYNLILSGYTLNFGTSLRATFMAELKRFLLLLLAFVPTITAALYIALYIPTDVQARLMTTIYETAISSSPQAIAELSQLIDKTFPHLSLFSGLYLITTIGAISPFVYKTYEYKMIPFILADNTEITYKGVKKRTLDIMDGFRWRFFLIQLSFMGYLFLIALMLSVTSSILIYCAATAMLLPYQYMTYIEFYRQRNEVIEHNIEVYGEQEI